MIDIVKYQSPYREVIIGDEEIIWLARMCIGEGGRDCTREHAAAMMWAMVNRYLLHSWRDKWHDLFVPFIRAFSQPINPRWQRGGDLAIKNAHKRSGSKAALKRREKICALEKENISEIVWAAVEDFADGNLPLPQSIQELDKPRISNWAAAFKWVQKKYPQGVNIGGNWFLEDDGLDEGESIVQLIGEIEEDLDFSCPDCDWMRKSDLSLRDYPSRMLLEELLRREIA